jgi:hypothetical protein
MQAAVKGKVTRAGRIFSYGTLIETTDYNPERYGL